MGKLKTPEWILEGYESKEDYEKANGIKNKTKKYKIKICPRCKSSRVKIILGGREGAGSKGWECSECKWKGKSVDEKEINESELLNYTNKLD